MAENVTLARPYAEAAFQLARDASTLPAWSGLLNRMASIAVSPEMQSCIGDPRLSAEQLSKLCVDVTGGALTADQQNFVRVLADNERLDVLPEISELFNQLKDAHEGTRQAEVESAFPLDETALRSLVTDLEQKFRCRIQATLRVVPELIGGVRIAMGDDVIDASVRGKLAAMVTALKN